MRAEKLNIDLKPGQKAFFTSDLHFGHRNVIRFAGRPYENEKEMDVGLIENWNSVVGEEDYVFVLGDMFWFPSKKLNKKIINKLNGKKFIIPGNHDDIESFSESDIEVLGDVCTLYLRTAEGKLWEIWMSHYPMITYPHIKANNTFQLFGHIHSKGYPYYEFNEPLKTTPGKQLDVGVDAHQMFPVSLESVLFELKAQIEP